MYVDINLAYTNRMQTWTNKANQFKLVDFIDSLITEKTAYIRLFPFGHHLFSVDLQNVYFYS